MKRGRKTLKLREGFLLLLGLAFFCLCCLFRSRVLRIVVAGEGNIPNSHFGEGILGLGAIGESHRLSESLMMGRRWVWKKT